MTEKERLRRERIRATLKKKYQEDPNYKSRLSRAVKTRWDKPGSHEAMSQIMIERNPMHSEEVRAKHLEATTSEEYRSKLHDKQKEIWENPDRRQRGIEACQKLWENGEIQKRKGKKMRENNPMANPEVRARWEETMHSPEVREAISEGQKKSWSLGGRLSRSSTWAWRYGEEWGEIRNNIFLRDGYRCQVCDYQGSRLSVHHVVPYVILPEHQPELLLTLCSNCHQMTERAFYRICARGELQGKLNQEEMPDMPILIEAGWAAVQHTKDYRNEQRLGSDANTATNNDPTSAPAAEGNGQPDAV